MFIEPDEKVSKAVEHFRRWMEDQKLGSTLNPAEASATVSIDEVMTPDDWVVRGAKFANNVIREWFTEDQKMLGLKPSDLTSKFQQSIKAFKAAADVGKPYLELLGKQIDFYQKRLLLQGKVWELEKNLVDIKMSIAEPKRDQVSIGDVIKLTTQLEQAGVVFEKGMMADVVEVRRDSTASKIKVLVRQGEGQAPLSLKLNQFRLMGAKTIDLKFEKEIAVLFEEAVACNRTSDAYNLIKIAQNLPNDPSQSSDEAEEDDHAAEGWIARRGKFFDEQLTSALQERIRKLESSTAGGGGLE